MKQLIGVFDSGVGGKSMMSAICAEMPDVEILLREDAEHLPYGNKSPEELLELVSPILDAMVSEGCQVIVIACNTVTTTIINDLRRHIAVPLIGVEPMLKPAVERSKSNIIAVCATPATLNSNRYQWLKATYAKNTQVLEPDCSEWASMIEANRLDHSKIRASVQGVCEAGADVIVLGCTHYHWIEEYVQAIAGEYRAIVLQPEQAVIAQLKRVIESLAIAA